MLTWARPWLVALAALGVLLSSGCRGADPNTPVDGHHELCCRAANPDNVSFMGCRVTSHCRPNEEVWVRGPVTCGPADPRACAGGRCCELELETPEGETPEGETPEGETPSEAASPTGEPASAQIPAPASAPITPVPFDGGA